MNFTALQFTTVKQPKLEMAELSVELLLDLVAGKTENKTYDIRNWVNKKRINKFKKIKVYRKRGRIYGKK